MATRLHQSIVEAITHANFMADPLQVERLAGAVVEGQQADGTYLRVILAHMQARLGAKPRRRGRTSTELESADNALEAVHAELYPHILKGVGPEDLPTDERNRRATFARSAASTVRYFMRGGGDVRVIEVATATKAGLRKMVQPTTEAPANETRAQKSFRLATDAVVKAAQRLLARGDPETARTQIEGALEALENLLVEMEEQAQPAQSQQPQQDFGGQTTTIVGRQPVGRGGGAPAGAILHRPAA